MAILTFELILEHQNHLLLLIFQICISKECGLLPSIEIHCRLLQGILFLRISFLILLILISLISLNCFLKSYFYHYLKYFINCYQLNSFYFILYFDKHYFDLNDRIFPINIACNQNIDY